VQAAFWANLDGWCAGIPVSGPTAYERIASKRGTHHHLLLRPLAARI